MKKINIVKNVLNTIIVQKQRYVRASKPFVSLAMASFNTSIEEV